MCRKHVLYVTSEKFFQEMGYLHTAGKTMHKFNKGERFFTILWDWRFSQEHVAMRLVSRNFGIVQNLSDLGNWWEVFNLAARNERISV